MMATAFLGYVLPYCQMSLWGATVIYIFCFIFYLKKFNIILKFCYNEKLNLKTDMVLDFLNNREIVREGCEDYINYTEDTFYD